MTTLEGRVVRRRRAIAPPGGTRSELWIWSELARRLGSPSTFSPEPEVVFEELRAASKGGIADYSGISYPLLDSGEAAFWPYPEGSSGTPRLFADRFATADGRANLTAVTVAATAEPLHHNKSLILITGRLLEHYQSGTQTRRVAGLAAAQPRSVLQIHPATAATHQIKNGDRVKISNSRGEAFAHAEITSEIRRDTVFLPFHYAGDESANLLSIDACDPISGMPEFKRNAVWIRPARPDRMETSDA